MKKSLLNFILLIFATATVSVKAQCVGNCTAYTTSTVTPNLYTGSGTSVFLGDDQLSSVFNIGFTFNFMCQAKTQFVISSNGFITLNPSEFNNGCCSGQFIPGAGTPNDLIAWCWDDLNPGNGGTITYTTIGVAPNRTCIVTYSQVPHFGMVNQNTGQIKLMETTDIIEIHNGLVNNGGTQTQGIENAAGSAGFAVSGRNASGWSTAGDAYRFSPVPGNNPSPPSAIMGPTLMCGPSSFIYSVNPSPGATSYTWSLPGGWVGSSNTNTIQVTPSGSGVMSVSATYTCGTSLNTTLSINVVPIPTVAISPVSQSICSGFSATMTASGANSYSWSNGATNAMIVVSPTAMATYSVIGNTSGCTGTAATNVTVNPTPTITTSGENGPICAGAPANLSASGANSYVWSNNAGNTASVTVNPLSSTSYTVVGTTSLGCSAQAVHFVSVVPLPNVSATGPGTICQGQTANFMAFGASSYVWSNGPQTATTVLIPNSTTTLTVTGTVPPNCQSTASIVVTVVPNPTLTVTSPATVCLGEPATLSVSGASSYSWSNGSTATSITVFPTNTSTYNVTGFSNQGCSSGAAAVVTVVVCNSLAKHNGEEILVNIFPNPNNGEFNVESKTGGLKSIELSDITGRIVYKADLDNKKTSINISQLSNGTYYARIKGEVGSAVFKITKQ